MAHSAYLLDLREPVRYLEAWDLQRTLAAAVSQATIPDTVVLLEHPPVITLGRTTGEGELHVPEHADVEIVETNRGGKSTYHGPGQLVCYPILDLRRHGKDVKKYVRDLEEAVIRTVAPLGVTATRLDGLTGVWLERPQRYAFNLAEDRRLPSDSPPQERQRPSLQRRKLASIGVHISRWVTTHGYALNVDLDPAPFTSWITACGLEDAHFTTIARELGRPVSVDDVRPLAANALADVFGLELEEPSGDDHALWPQPVQATLAAEA
ncbi:MAG: lipoyl(octanoyl) transferase LipB [Actinomycetota bacterium]|nr:lipoyl(octanoyl) transferase LipB [Actinomycetota bacterium]